MNAIRRQFFLTYAVMGSLLPYVSVWLEGRGLSDAEVGYVISTIGVGVIVSPLVVTLLADTWMQPRRLLGMQMLAVSASLLMMLASGSFWVLLGAHLCFALALTPAIPLQDAILFSRQSADRAAGRKVTPYHLVRVFGTAGFLLPSIALFVHLRQGGSMDWVLGLGAGFAVLGAINTRWLPERVPLAEGSTDSPAGGTSGQPTLAAARRVLRPDAIVFAAAMWLLFIAMSAYYTFYPILLTRPVDGEGIGIDPAWIGLIANLGVAIEIPFMLAFGWLLKHLGLRGLMTLGAAAMAMRMGLLYFLPIPAVAVATQGFHGLMVLVVHVAPPVFFNRFAEERFRSSIQGLYIVMVTGTGRIVGNVTAGQVAETSLSAVFFYATLLCVIATALFALAFRPRRDAAISEA